MGDMSIRDKILSDLKSAMKNKDVVRLSTLRLVSTAIKDRDIAARAEDRCQGCDSGEILAILQKLAKQRDESAEMYENAGRLDLAEKERAEAEIVREYLPKPMEAEEIEAAARDVVEELGATGLKDMGKCMGALKERYTGRMDFSQAGARIKSLLTNAA
ncbi:MAG: aspartyl-tRNA amidotransferase subunit B [Hyphobacterium sp.]|nr:MAG: aspartyl-tRNA amidotransferase subunit B [Hyphobacterium sp.]